MRDHSRALNADTTVKYSAASGHTTISCASSATLVSGHIPLYERAGRRGGGPEQNVQPNTALLLYSTSPMQQLQTHKSDWIRQLKKMSSTYSVSLGAEKIEVRAGIVPVRVPGRMHRGRGSLGQDLASNTLLTLRAVRAGHECAT